MSYQQHGQTTRLLASLLLQGLLLLRLGR